MNAKLSRINEIAAEIRLLFPGKSCVILEVTQYGEMEVNLELHGHETYAAATEEMRSLGIGRRNKTPYADAMVYTQLDGEADGVNVTTYPNELPPSCHIETVVEKIPKQSTVDTGEFIEVKRSRVVCTGAYSEQKAVAA